MKNPRFPVRLLFAIIPALLLLLCHGQASFGQTSQDRSVSSESDLKPENSASRIFITGLYTTNSLPVILRGKIDNILFAIFSSSDRFESTSLSTVTMNLDTAARLGNVLAPSSRRTSRGFSDQGWSIRPETLKEMQQSYGIIIPRLVSYKTRKKDGLRSMTMEIILTILNPRSGAMSTFAHLSTSARSSNRFILYSRSVRDMGKQLTRVLNEYAVFTSETEIDRQEGLYVWFSNKELFTPRPGMEFTVFTITRFPDGYVEDEKTGYIRVQSRDERFWKGKSIFGEKPERGDYLRYSGFYGLQGNVHYTLYNCHIPGNRYTSRSNVHQESEEIRFFHGLGLTLSAEFGYAGRFYLDSTFLIDDFSWKTRIWEFSLGFSWVHYPAPNWLFQLSGGASLRYMQDQAGTLNTDMEDGSKAGEKLIAKSYTPGIQLRSSLSWMLERNLILKASLGYAYFFPVSEDRLSYATKSNPDFSSDIRLKETIASGGPLLEFSFNLRI